MAENSPCAKYVHEILQNPNHRASIIFGAIIKKTTDYSFKIQCAECSPQTSFMAKYEKLDKDAVITICNNICKSRMQVDDALSHELIHAYDDIDGALTSAKEETKTCEAWVCSEVRAANLSGDCKFSRELLRGNILPIASHQQLCIKRRALLSILNCEYCKDTNATDILGRMFTKCFHDLAPLGNIP